MERERHLEQKHTALFWLRDLFLTALPESGAGHFLDDPGSAAHWIHGGKWPGISGRTFDVPVYFQRMTRNKLARFTYQTMRELAAEGELILCEHGKYRRASVLEKLAKLGG